MQATLKRDVVRLSCRVRKGRLILRRSVPVRDGVVEVVVRVPAKRNRGGPRATARQLKALPLFGIWKDRPEMSDPVAYVQSLRRKQERRGNGA